MKAIYKPKLRQFTIEVILALALFLLGLNSILVEKIYVHGIYPYTSLVQRFLSAFFPFALGDFLYILLMVYCGRSLYVFCRKIKKKKLQRADRVLVPLQFINFTLLLYILFKLLWGLNYSRLPLPGQLGIDDEKYNTKELVRLGDYLIDQINQIQSLRALKKSEHYTIDELQTKAAFAYGELAKKNTFFTYKAPAVKGVLNSWAITKIGLEGYYCPLSGEANVNMRLTRMNLPFVTCHEISHQLGIAREDEANLVGYLVSMASPDANFRYSGIYCVLKNVLFEIGVKSPSDYLQLRKKINPVTLKDFKADKEFWRTYNSDMFGYMEVTLDQFLKLNNQQKGVESYQDIVLWLYNIHKKDLKR